MSLQCGMEKKLKFRNFDKGNEGMKHKRAWWIFAGCCVMGLLFVGMICNTAGLYFQDMADEMHLPMTKVTLTMSFLNAGGLLGALFSGRLLMKFDVRIVSSAAAALSGFGFLLAASCHGITGFYLLWLIVGISTPCLITITIPTILGNWFEQKLGMVIGIVYGLSGIGGALFNVLAGQIIASFGWRWGLRLEGILALVGILPFTILIFRTKPGRGECAYGSENVLKVINGGSSTGKKILTEENIPEKLQPEITAKQAHTMKDFYLYIAAGMALTIVSSLLQQVSPYIGSLGYDITVSSAVMSAVMMGCAVGNVLMGNLLDRCTTLSVIRLYAALGAAGWFGIAFFRQQALLMVFGAMAGLAQSIFQTGLPFCYRKTFGSLEFSRISADLALPSSTLAIFSASLGGIIYDLTGSYLPVMLLLGVMFLVAEPCIAVVLKNK